MSKQFFLNSILYPKKLISRLKKHILLIFLFCSFHLVLESIDLFLESDYFLPEFVEDCILFTILFFMYFITSFSVELLFGKNILLQKRKLYQIVLFWACIWGLNFLFTTAILLKFLGADSLEIVSFFIETLLSYLVISLLLLNRLSDKKNKNCSSIILNLSSGMEKIETQMISHISIQENYSSIYIFLNSDYKELIVRSTLKELLKKLPENDFIQVHRSHIINQNFVQKYERVQNGFKLSIKHSSIEVPVSKRRVNEVKCSLDTLWMGA